MQTNHVALASLLFLSVTGVAFAGPVDDAQSHFRAIAAGEVENIMHGYADNAHFEWVGGPLNGTYVGTDKIKETWTKFAKANAPLEATVSKVEESVNPAGSTITANVVFKGKSTIKVRYVLTYRDGKLANEIWQIDPKLVSSY